MRNMTTVNLKGTAMDGRVYLNCSTNALKASCSVSTADPLSKSTVNLRAKDTAAATVTLITTASGESNGSAGSSAGTPPGTYEITVNAYAETNASPANRPVPDVSVQIPVTVQ